MGSLVAYHGFYWTALLAGSIPNWVEQREEEGMRGLRLRVVEAHAEDIGWASLLGVSVRKVNSHWRYAWANHKK